MSIKAIRDAVKNSHRDAFDVGTVIRWTSSSKYIYVAVKSPVGWFTTARYNNSFVPQVVDFDTLLEILSRSETSDIKVASTWESVEEGSKQDEDLHNVVCGVREEQLNSLAQTFYDHCHLGIPMTAKPEVVEGLRAVLYELSTHTTH